MSHSPTGFSQLNFVRYAPDVMQQRARAFREDLERRRSVRHFTSEDVPQAIIDECILAAGSAPSGAHRQPWTFLVVRDEATKRAVREAAEVEERENYSGRMNDEWLEALSPLGTDEHKPFLEVAPLLIVVMRHAWGDSDGKQFQNYYTQESVGIASGMLLAALHHAGLATLTHTPSPMGFLQRVLGRPKNEKPYLLIPVGYPVEGCEVPDLERKPLDEIRVMFEGVQARDE
ncbi:MAG: iodotyrosine deiodinase [Planctomycetota bacterium]|jgi:iodotyrosine deiodinase